MNNILAAESPKATTPCVNILHYLYHLTAPYLFGKFNNSKREKQKNGPPCPRASPSHNRLNLQMENVGDVRPHFVETDIHAGLGDKVFNQLDVPLWATHPKIDILNARIWIKFERDKMPLLVRNIRYEPHLIFVSPRSMLCQETYICIDSTGIERYLVAIRPLFDFPKPINA